MYMDCILLFTTSQCKPNLVNIATSKTSKYWVFLFLCLSKLNVNHKFRYILFIQSQAFFIPTSKEVFSLTFPVYDELCDNIAVYQ